MFTEKDIYICCSKMSNCFVDKSKERCGFWDGEHCIVDFIAKKYGIEIKYDFLKENDFSVICKNKIKGFNKIRDKIMQQYIENRLLNES